jgi:hypothetical protein
MTDRDDHDPLPLPAEPKDLPLESTLSESLAASFSFMRRAGLADSGSSGNCGASGFLKPMVSSALSPMLPNPSPSLPTV